MQPLSHGDPVQVVDDRMVQMLWDDGRCGGSVDNSSGRAWRGRDLGAGRAGGGSVLDRCIAPAPVCLFVTVSPLLTPGVVIRISTLIFWGQMAPRRRRVPDRHGASQLHAAYATPMFMARLTRFDRRRRRRRSTSARPSAGVLAHHCCRS